MHADMLYHELFDSNMIQKRHHLKGARRALHSFLSLIEQFLGDDARALAWDALLCMDAAIKKREEP